MSEYEVQINGYIPRSPNAKAKQHWGRKMDERLFWEAAIARHMWGIPDPSACGVRWVEYEIWKPGKVRLRDEDNLNACVKQLQDAMVHLDLLIDDSPEWLEYRGVTESNGHPRYSTIIRFGDV